MDRNIAKIIGEEVKLALAAIAKAHGMTVELTGGKYDSTVGTFAPKVIFKEGDSAKRTYEMFATAFGLPADSFGKTFLSHGLTFTITGIRPAASKKPVLAQHAGKEYIFSSAFVAAQLA